jgi:N-methylhydantoinase A/oxoprolinase/acetone carboxylase beta subunit
VPGSLVTRGGAVRVGVDVGGPSTGLVGARPDGILAVGEVSFTPHGSSVVAGRDARGPRTLTRLPTTRGLRGVPELGRTHTPDLHDLSGAAPGPAARRRSRDAIRLQDQATTRALHAPRRGTGRG